VLNGPHWFALQQPSTPQPLHGELSWMQQNPFSQTPPSSGPVHGQTLPHAPQLLMSLSVSTHWPAQGVYPGGQQAPLVHWEPLGQTWPQPPQLLVSDCVLTQPPGQRVWPPGQQPVSLQAPAQQTP